MPNADELPGYEPLLAAFHRAFAPELEAMVSRLPIRPGDRVLEMACGDGVYTAWLADRVGPTGVVVAVDISPAYLKVAREASAGAVGEVEPVAAPIERLPFPRGEFDVVFCAQSLFSLPDQSTALATMAGLARPGGVVAVIEDDTNHQLLLPWPIDVELAVRSAERDVSAAPEKFYVGRRLRPLFEGAGLVDVRVEVVAATRLAPLPDPDRDYLAGYLAELRDQVGHRLAPEVKARFLDLADPESPTGLIRQVDLAMTRLLFVVTGVRGG